MMSLESPVRSLQLQRLQNRLRRSFYGRGFEVWYDPAFRLPLSALEGLTGFEPRRADYVAWYLVDVWALHPAALRTPERVHYRLLERVHSAEYLESLTRPETLARIFAVDPSDVQVDEVLSTVRLACGATVGAARRCAATGCSALNLFGGFHHAGPESGGGFCAMNDIAVAVADLRESGFHGPISVLDLDAHPPDGLAAAFLGQRGVWVGSISGSDWGALEGVDETVLPAGSDNATYLRALGGLLGRMPKPALAFVIAGGDVLAGDRLGKLGLDLWGLRERDLAVVKALGGTPSVWLPGGGYSEQSWQALAGTGLALCCRSRASIADDYDPLRAKFGWIAKTLSRDVLAGGPELSMADLEEELGVRPPHRRRLLGYYSTEGVEYALSHYGILPHLRRLGYDHFRVTVEATELGDAVRTFGFAGGQKHMLMEVVLERKRIADHDLLYVHWLTLRNPRGRFSPHRPQLPGQDAPGLGVAREIGEVLARIARRLKLAGVAFRPAWHHTAYSGRYHFQFIDPARQGRFEALMRDLGHISLLEVTRAAADGRILMNGEPYVWEADEMAFWLVPSPLDLKAVEAEKERVTFTIGKNSTSFAPSWRPADR